MLKNNIFKLLKTIIIFFLLFIVKNTYASTWTWDFTSSGDYTISSSTGITITWSLATLNQNTLVHTWVISNATNYNWAYDVVVDWNYAYMTNFLWNRVSVLDISNPSSPTLVGSVIDSATTYLVWVSWIIKDGNYLYVASNTDDAVQVIDVSTPSSPTVIWSLRDTTNLNWARWIAKTWNYLLVTTDVRDAVTVINVSNPATPTRVTTLRDTTNLNWARDIKISWNYAYVASYDWDRLTVLNITTPTSPTVAWNINDGTNLNWAHNVEISWNYAYVSAYLNASVRVIDITTPTSPTAVTNISWWNFSITNPRDLLVDWDYLYIASYGSDVINIADISNPISPSYVTSITHNASNPLLDWADWLYKVWDFIYVASYISDALEILRLSYQTTSPYIQPITPLNYWTANNLLTFSQTLWAWNQWTVTYQISKNNWTTWYYWNWSAWTSTTWWVSNSSSASVINSNLSSFNLISWGTWLFTFRAYLTSDWVQNLELDQVQVTASDPASPWWITGMSLWLKANKWTNSTTDWASITSWADQSGNWYDATTWVAPSYVNNDTNNLNYNPLINFNWTSYLENLNNWSNSTTYFIVIVPTSKIDWTITWEAPFWFDCTSWVLSSWTCWLPFAWSVLGAFTISMNDEVISHAIWASTARRSAQIWAYSYAAGNPMLIWYNENASANGTDIYEKWIKIDNYTTNTYQKISTADYRIWRSLDSANPFPYTWKVAEIIDYTTRLTDTDRQKIESYLAVKYGITLSWGTLNYIASDWTTIWSIASAWTYTYNIFWIWRDDSSWLWQVKSKSSNDSSVITLEAIWEWTNISNSFVDISNKEFFMVSNNNWSNTWTQTWNPTWYEILTRKWKVQEIWDVWTLNLDFDVWNTNFDIPIYNSWSLYYFVYDSNNNWLLSDETPIAMTNTAWSIWKVSWLNLSNWQIFTLAWITSLNNAPTNITLSNNTINENIVAGSTIWTLSTTDSDSWDTHTYSFVVWIWDTDNSSFTLSWNILKINESPDYEIKNTYYIRIQTDDWHWWQFQKQFTININNVWEAINSIIDFETPWKYTVTSWIWSRVTTNPYEGSYSIQSNNQSIANSQSCFEVTNTFYGWTWTISFYYYVSSQSWWDYLRFYIDNVEQQNWSWTVPWTLYTNSSISAWNHIYKWCYIKDWSINTWTDNAYVDYITFINNNDLIPPTIASTNYSSWYLLPWWNHNLIIYYNDASSWVNTWSSLISLYKWNWTAWWSDISSTWLNLAWKTITTTQATYPTNNLSYWKYYYNFQISDNMANTSSTWVTFYIDEPVIILNTWSLDLWNLSSQDWLKFSSWELIVTIKTLWAPFQLQLLKNTDLVTWSWSIIIDWDWTKWVWYDKSPYTYVNKNIWTYPVIWTWALNINTNWDNNIYNFPIKIWTLIWEEQSAWNYIMNVSFRSIFEY